MSQIVTTAVQPGGWALLTIKREPVNSMNLELWQGLQAALDACEADPAIRGIIITSGLQRPIFTAGNDLLELFAPKTTKERYIQFWKTSNKFLANLYNSPLVTISAIDGYCPAGGTALSVELGISVPAVWMKLYATLVGAGKMDKLCQFAQMVPAKEGLSAIALTPGLKIGLVDQLVPAKADVLPAASAIMTKLLKLPDSGRILVKKNIRTPLAEELGSDARLQTEAENGWYFLTQPQTIKALSAVFARLSKAKM
ncbi:dodecenoyl-CoA isomerase [Kappamyces sp. JEL0680]|nr:dodecenoyl-CoA isomerase [Kappamyces sp. JEL0680]